MTLSPLLLKLLEKMDVSKLEKTQGVQKNPRSN